MRRFLIVACALLLVPLVATAAEFMDYPEFRYASGLPGGSNGVTPEGRIGFDGAMQVNIPVGYTPGWGNFMLTGSVGAVNGGFPDSYAGHNNNGTLTAGFGMFHKYKTWISEMGTGKAADNLEPVENVQVEIIPEGEHCPGISVGVVDIFDRRAASRTRPFDTGGRSFYVVATREGGTEEKPFYYTLGFGSGRFNDGPFGGISYQPLPRVKVMAEYDGWVGNVGAAYDVVRSDEWHGIFSFSLIDLERIDIAISFTKTSF